MSEKKILVVDDEKAIISLMDQAFSRSGFIVAQAESAEAAIEILKQEKILVLFIDLNLPKMDGLELCKRVKKDNPISIIHAVTGYSSLFELVDCIDAGFDDYFKKPVDIRILIKAATEAFEKIERWTKK